jgi:imidazole glycerol-phosphate synthase subunit HisH
MRRRQADAEDRHDCVEAEVSSRHHCDNHRMHVAMPREQRPVIGCIRYGTGNVSALALATRLAGGTLVPISDAAGLAHVSGCLLPGVGAFGVASRSLESSQLGAAIRQRVDDDPTFGVFGICLGLQLLGIDSAEAPGHGLGLIAGRSVSLGDPQPRIGWLSAHELHNSAKTAPMYFCHAYHFVPDDPGVVTQRTGEGYVAAVRSANIWGTQYHPEKSFEPGHQILTKFVDSLKGSPQ